MIPPACMGIPAMEEPGNTWEISLTNATQLTLCASSSFSKLSTFQRYRKCTGSQDCLLLTQTGGSSSKVSLIFIASRNAEQRWLLQLQPSASSVPRHRIGERCWLRSARIHEGITLTVMDYLEGGSHMNTPPGAQEQAGVGLTHSGWGTWK